MKNILIAEDDQSIIDVVTIILQEEGYEARVARQQKELYQELQQQTPHVVLLDIRLGESNGQAIARRLKTQKTTRAIPLVIMSAAKAIEKIAKETVADAFLLKPFTIEELLAVIKEHSS